MAHSAHRLRRRPAEIPAISANGRFVAFVTDANNLVRDDHDNDRDVFVREL
jgi:hypothetical protein